MSAEEIIKEIQKSASEWLEMSRDPDALLLAILANKVSKLSEYIQYLEKRVDHESRKKNRIN